MIDCEVSKLETGNCRLRTADCGLPTDFPKQVESVKLSRMLRLCMGLIPALLWSLLSFAAQGNKDADLVREIEDNLIAPCCWSQPVSQHYSEVAEQIRTEVRAMVAEGMTRDEILDHYVAIYGERILATPRAEGFNMLAYVLPWAALVFGAWLLIVLAKRLRSPAPSPIPVDVPYARYASRIEREMKEFEE
jgi:cytochrome c-type biogenesis protein CcmH